MKTGLLFLTALFFSISFLFGQKKERGKKPAPKKRSYTIEVLPQPSKQKVEIRFRGELFTSYRYPDNVMKPILWPIIAPGGMGMTRSFPIEPKPGERTDHPHHVGLWFNHGDVNGHDFWNNSLDIGKEHKGPFGKIRHRAIRNYHSGNDFGDLLVESDWLDQSGKPLLEEKTYFRFEQNHRFRSITRWAMLEAREDSVFFRDNKEGLLGLRVARFLELPNDKPELFTDAKGNKTNVPVMPDQNAKGNYFSSEGMQGDAVWGKRARWMQLKSKKGTDSAGILIMDHPNNPGFPAHWHARGYGLFSINNLGAKIFSGGKESLDMIIPPGGKKLFAYKLFFWSGKAPKEAEIEAWYAAWLAESNPAF